MGSLFAFMGSLAVSLPSRIVASLGLGLISYAGYAVVVNSLVDAMVSTWSNIGTDVLAYISLAGFPTGLGIILGCMVTRMTLSTIKHFGVIA